MLCKITYTDIEIFFIIHNVYYLTPMTLIYGHRLVTTHFLFNTILPGYPLREAIVQPFTG